MLEDDTGRAELHDDAVQSPAGQELLKSHEFPPLRPRSSVLGASNSDSNANLNAPTSATDALLPPDTGFAWVFLAAAFTCETLVSKSCRDSRFLLTLFCSAGAFLLL